MNFREWILSNAKKESTAKHYYGAIYGERLNDLLTLLGFNQQIFEIDSIEKFSDIHQKLIASPAFKELNKVGNRMYSAALNHYASYLKSIATVDAVEKDMAEIAEMPVTETEKTELRQTRIGQGKYRRKLMTLWNNRCSVTGYAFPQMLLASHIKPWSLANNAERLSPANGLLLTPNLDKAFDQGFISFSPKNGEIIISPYLPQPDTLGIHHEMKLWQLSEKTPEFLDLEYHNDRILLSGIV